MSSPPGTMVNKILDRIIQAFQEQGNRERIQNHCINPLLKHILNYMFPYIILTCIIFSIILLLSLMSVVLLVLHLRSPMAMGIASPMAMASPMASPAPMAMAMAAPVPMAMAAPVPVSALTESLINTTP